MSRLNEAAARLRHVRVAPLEAELPRLLLAGPEEAARDLARRVLAELPGSAVARRALRELEARETESRCEALLACAAEHENAGALAPAAACLRQVAELDPRRRALLASRIASLEDEAAERTRRQAAAVLLDHLRSAAPPPAEALLAYLRSDAGTQGLARAGFPDPVLDRLDRLAAAGTPPEEAVAALQALAEAEAALAGGSPEAAVALLAPHRNLRSTLPEARKVASEAARQASENERHRAHTRLERLAAAMAVADLATARAAADGLVMHLLPADAGERAGVLLAALEAAERGVALARQVAERVAAGDLMGARADARRMAERAAGEARAQWQERVGALEEELRQAWRVEVLRGPGLGLDLFGEPWAREDRACPWLTPDGARAVLVDTRLDWVFLWVVDVASGTVEQAVKLRTPAPLGLPVVVVEGGLVWIAGDRANAVALALDRWTVERWYPASRLVSSDEVIDDVLLPPGGRFLWLQLRNLTTKESSVVVVELAALAARRRLRRLELLSLVLGDQPRVADESFQGPAVVMTPGGDRDSILEAFGKRWLVGLAPHPCGPGWVAALEEEASDELDERRVVLVEVAPDGSIGEPFTLGAASEDCPPVLVTARAAKVLLVFHPGDGLRYRLVALRSVAGRLEPLFRKDLPRLPRLLTDTRSLHAVALSYDARDGRVILTPLGAGAPALPRLDTKHGRALIRDWSIEMCRPSRERSAQLPGERLSPLDRLPPELRRPRSERLVAGLAGDQDALIELLEESRFVSWGAEIVEDVRRSSSTPPLPRLALALADRLASQDKWSSVRELLEDAPCGSGDLAPDEARHLHHLLGLALARDGRRTAALAVWRRGRSFAGACDLAACADLV
ncbi:MAG: hypothetical protein V1750_04305, partial [Acidobacteriota bacterium]